MEQQLNDLLAQAKKAIASSTSLEQLNNLQVEYLGKKSVLNEFLKGMKDLPHEERLIVGQLANKIKGELTALWQATRKELELAELTAKLNEEKIDVTLPGFNINSAGRHPLMLVIEEITNVFNGLGYDVIFGPEVESDEFNFQKLNLPKDHPARDMQDTFYITESTLLRTHCTNMTARMLSQMQDNEEVIAVISAGNTYRRDDDDATHSHQFMQIDGFLVAPNISFANLKWTIQYFCERMFGENAKTRLRPSFFPFTEPSVEVDVTCICCGGQGCSICKKTGWIEIMGAGMINPLVYEACGQSKDLTGFAFGIGIERIAMLKYGVDDIRRFYTNNIKFLEQFRNFN
ncbi:phenylalanyl-tRNA synthetase subunit alpha [Spiroplasma syrphidicola EA-1]|uniref:Phenylalanine--tRNA ligase alpha subunit n=1 Tax=Spiroplasma syrphidicola EA-1 TaxID=1276229 RepID=R4U488_9MOLU|nr:phenylalanine--tRNA ligase subunit alpha [Spiroplasma syrphidicola]AGM26272.1 phenylalanyl-tRNA synthetase subunit alpha [Spiroplasma syrphidicola EA-1]